MPEPVEYMGVWAVQQVIPLGSEYIERKLPRDATLRRGPGESALWRVQRVRLWQMYKDTMPASKECPVLFSVNEAAWAVGITRTAFLRLAGKAPAVALSAGEDKTYALYPEQMLAFLRREIGRGAITVPARQLTRPKAGVVIAPARHTLNQSQRIESEYLKAQSWQALAL